MRARSSKRRPPPQENSVTWLPRLVAMILALPCPSRSLARKFSSIHFAILFTAWCPQQFGLLILGPRSSHRPFRLPFPPPKPNLVLKSPLVGASRRHVQADPAHIPRNPALASTLLHVCKKLPEIIGCVWERLPQWNRSNAKTSTCLPPTSTGPGVKLVV